MAAPRSPARRPPANAYDGRHDHAEETCPLPLAIALSASLGFAAPAFASTAEHAPATAALATAAAPAPLLQAAELKSLIGQPGVRVLDIRADKDYAAGHVPSAVNTPTASTAGRRRTPASCPRKPR